ncbi:hypothetical protein E5161_05755 [Cohnella pontilimi]|uniref:Uncharacterized protein n=1 Tax=Cohnella pontilimi TaxID=2564100 RepID=A0A4U0FEM5_9BACL|nr:hypothetical protein [Cohnella pontilimi]TJY43393.1 hypothetical protein E5161_05755 [Cohnella pontilimi]
MMERKYGLDMHLPENKLPGFYAQIVKGIAERAELFDRHRELLIFDSPAAYPPVFEMLAHYKVEAEPCELLMFSEESVCFRSGRFEDFAFATRAGNVYVDLAYTAVFRLTEARPGAESAPALLQLEEHRIADVCEDGQTWHLIESQLAELAERVARAYGCGVEWFTREPQL